MPLTPGMCPRAIKAEHRGIYVKMSISTTGAQFPWTRKCVVSRRNAGKNSRHLYRTRSFGLEFFFPEMRSRSTKVKILRDISVQQNDENFNIIVYWNYHVQDYLDREFSPIFYEYLKLRTHFTFEIYNNELLSIYL